MDIKSQTLEHLAGVLRPYRLHDLQDVCERFYLDAGDGAQGLHEASILQRAAELCREPLGGEDGFGDLTWRMGPDEQGLPYLRVQAVRDNLEAAFTIAPPFTEDRMAQAFQSADGEDSAMAVDYVFELLDEEDRADTLRYMCEDAQECLRSLRAADRLAHSDRLEHLLRDAIARGNDEAALDAVELGAPLNNPDLHGDTPLHLVARHGRDRLILPMFEAGAWVNEANKEGQTPLHLAAAAGSSQCCLMLMAVGAGALRQDFQGRTPADLAGPHGLRHHRVHEHVQGL